MYYVALRMLMGDTTRYLALCAGLAFSSTLVIQQGSIFTGFLRRTAVGIDFVPQAEIWVMHPATQYFDERKPLPETALQRVRGVEGIEWAEPLYVGAGSALLPGGKFANIQVVGFDRVSKIGLPPYFEGGGPELLNQDDAILWDDVGVAIYQTVRVGTELEINDRRAQVVGRVVAPRRFAGGAVVYTTYERALEYSPGERNRLSFVLAKVKRGYDARAVARAVADRTGLGALTAQDFYWSTVLFYLKNTGIPINFGITVLLGAIVGVAVAGQTFYSFTVENARHFGTLKALGVSNAMLTRMVLLQAGLVGLAGWGLGAGAAALFGANITPRSAIAFLLTPHLLAISFVLMVCTVLAAALISIRRVQRVEPAIVFR